MERGKPPRPKLAMAAHTRVALTMVARGEAPLGIVYTTDANGARYCGNRRPHCVENLRPGPSAAAEVSPSVKIIGTFPAEFSRRRRALPPQTECSLRVVA